ncbi:hypothetical protein [Thermoactinomyces sp. DSM 45891]|uniref:hypothetical protein n=1 Tax=Thermoactinomyces sp. DSM 45891 TaxID=1761907 RepID=UPI000931D22E|nr:hypothetical protein [Thermoactinomyces sp. DSM 45891]
MKKFRLKLGNETYGTKNILQAFQEAFSPTFSPDKSNQRVNSTYESMMKGVHDPKEGDKRQ